jgi:hypothetical protein
MQMDIAKECSKLGDIFDHVVSHDKALARAAQDFQFQVGPASDSRYGVPAHAQDAIFVGDSAHILGHTCDAFTEALLKTDPNRVQIRPRYDAEKQGWTMEFSSKPTTDAPDFLGGQLFSPWNVSYFKQIFQEPLSYSRFEEMVRVDSGTNPWTELMTLYYEQYAGFAMSTEIGGLRNSMINDVNVINGLMSAPVLNLGVTYSMTLEEQKRAEVRGNPFGRQSMTNKQKYANYSLKIMSDYIGYYGNTETNTTGLLNVNSVVPWGARSLKAIYLDSGTNLARGSEAYRALALILNDFMNIADNKYHTIKIAMSPEAKNYLESMPYSDVYDPTSALKIFLKNYGVTDKEASKLNIEFIADPMLKAGSIFNPNTFDYLVITSPEVGGGPDNVSQPLVLYGAPLSEFVFPAIPGMYNTQYKTLKRVAGVFAPVPSAIRVYSGFGVNGAE